MVTPSLVIVGAPHFLSSTTLRPRGPSVTLTVLASLSMPASRDRRAASLNASCFAMVCPFKTEPRAADRSDENRQDQRHGDPESYLTTIARTSRADSTRYSSPPVLTSVPPYLE